ncbi:MAG: fatty acid desaturase [Planctomycetales bacterium]|nr:fatty acid desaturase [Planctomycetales bacterium]
MTSLEVPQTVKPYQVYWVYAGTLVVGHLLALLAIIPYFFSWTGLILMVIGVHVFGQGITIGYHRLLTHRSFRTPRWVEHCFAIVGICCLQDTPVRWVATHRIHHNHSDEGEDPHTPLVNFVWSHCGWLMYRNRNTQSLDSLQKFARDLLQDPFYMHLERHPYTQVWIWLAHVALYFVGGLVGSLATGGDMNAAVQLGLSCVVWGVIVRTVFVWHITWSVNSLSHLFGYRNYDTTENSKNNWVVAMLTVGEGWHNNHHEDPSACTVQHRWWEVDISHYEVQLLRMLGLAWDIIPPKYKRQSQRRNRAAANAARPEPESDKVSNGERSL